MEVEQEERGESVGVSPAGSMRWRVVTYNVHSFNDGRFGRSFPRTLKELRELQPDLLALNEALHPFHPTSSGSHFDHDEDGLQKEFQKFLKSAGFSTSANDEDENDNPNETELVHRDTYLDIISKALNLPYWTVAPAGCGLSNALFSRWPLKRAESITLKAGDYETRSLIVATTAIPPGRAGDPDIDVDLLVTHLEHTNEKVRMEQLEHCLSYADPSRPMLLMGDLNAFDPDEYGYRHSLMIKSYFARRYWVYPKPEVIRHLTQLGFVDCWKYLRSKRDSAESTTTASTEQQNPDSTSENLERRTMLTDEERRMCTVWVGNPLLRIDYIFCTRAFINRFDLLECRSVHQCDASDHFPLLLDFGSRPPASP